MKQPSQTNNQHTNSRAEGFVPDWPLPAGASAWVSQCHATDSVYGSNNLALHVGDDAEAVNANRANLARHAGVADWQWLTQVHGTRVLEVNSPAQLQESALGDAPEADGVVTNQLGLACAVLTADCLPVLLCNTKGTQVGAVHAGWRGLACGILAEAVTKFAAGEDLTAYLGPAIGPLHFEVGPEVKAAFEQVQALTPNCFVASERANHWYGNLYSLADQQLRALGVKEIFGGGFCTYRDESFYSFRRSGCTGRFASAIWLNE